MSLERLLPVAVLASAAALAASELTVVFELTSPAGEALESVTGSDRHNYSMALLALFAVVAMVVALGAASRPAAAACAVAGGLALIVFLVGDLPDVNRVGTLDDPDRSFVDARAEPQAGFWLLLVGSVGLAFAGGALASLRSDQLESLRASLRRDRPEGEDGADPDTDAGDTSKRASSDTSARGPSERDSKD